MPEPADVAGSSRRRALQLGGLIALTVLLTVAVPGRRGWFDIGVYHDAVTYWIGGHGRLYDYVRPGSPYGFTYPPFAAICMLPMAWLSWYSTIAINLTLTALASAFLLYVWIDPIARRPGRSRWFTFGVAACLLALLVPIRDTVGYGQINLVLVALVYTDLVLIELGRGRYAGIGTGLAAAIKLTPAIFIVYLLVTRRWWAAARAAVTFVTATAFATAIAPNASRAYFTAEMWRTSRVGDLANVANQSVMGLVARIRPDHPDRAVWLVTVAAIVVAWIVRVRQAAATGDHRAGFALTGIAACLISPVTWVHHLVWLVPGLIILAAAGVTADRGQRLRRRWAAGAVYALLCSGIVWLWWLDDRGVIGFIGSNSYVFVALGMLLTLPVHAVPAPAPVPVPVPRRWHASDAPV